MGDLVFEETPAGQTAMVTCPTHQAGSISRLCTEDGVWEEPQNNCRRMVDRSFENFISIHSSLETVKCPSQSIPLRSGTYEVPVSEVGSLDIPCQSGYLGTLSFTCNESYEWDIPRDVCGMYFSFKLFF